MFLQKDSSFFKFRNNQLGFGTLAYSVMRVETGDCIRWQVVGTRAQSRLWSTLTPLRSREASVNRSTTDS